MANRNLPTLDELEVLSTHHNKVTYTAFHSFNFESAWEALRNAGAKSCNIVPNPESDCLEIDVFFGDRTSDESSSPATHAPATQAQEWEFARWQYYIALTCIVGATAVAAQGVLL
tara:strand:+ start:284 stop:628 length:345 start_codon:yes stop_codon:yes gene_type:complete